MIAVATLLVAVVGATFAYFTATNKSEGTGGSKADVTTAQTSSVKLSVDPATVTNPEVLYPGGYLVSGAHVTATKEAGEKEYTVTYTLNYEVDATALSETSKVKYSLYRATKEVSTPINDCVLKTDEAVDGEDGKNKVHMTGCTPNTTDLGEELKSATEVTGGSTTGKQTLTYSETTGVSTDDGTGYYYYLLVEFVDNDDKQDDDQGKKIVAQITSATNAVVKEKAGA